MSYLFYLSFLVIFLNCQGEFQPPPTLKDWGLLEIISEGNSSFLKTSPNSIPYTLKNELFTDYALKLRTIHLPEGKSIDYKKEGVFGFPVGTVITKTFFYPKNKDIMEYFKDDYLLNQIKNNSSLSSKPSNDTLPSSIPIDLNEFRLLETRVLVHLKNGWVAFPYIWNEENSNAKLSNIGGNLEVEFFKNGKKISFEYEVPNKNQCQACHIAKQEKTIQPIGPKAIHLHLTRDYHQLNLWKELGLLANTPDVFPDIPEWKNPQSGSLEFRARAYLDINCAHCHNPNGPANTSGLYLNYSQTEENHLGICKTSVAAGYGAGNRPYAIFPGRPELSILVYRMETTRPGEMMPELGRKLSHEEAIVLMKNWIQKMEGDCKPSYP